MFDEDYNTFRDGQVSLDIRGACKDGAVRFRGQVKAPKDKQMLEGGKDFGAVLEGEWKGAFFQNFLKLKVKPDMLDAHFDAGHKSFNNNTMKTNFWWGLHVPTKAQGMNWWQWAWKAGAITQADMHGWNCINATAFVWNPNASKTGPGAMTVEKHSTITKDKHEIHMSTWANVEPGTSWCHNHSTAYKFSSDKWMMYLKHAWNLNSLTSKSTAVGVTLAPCKHFGGAYRADLNTVDKDLTHSFGLQGKFCNEKLYLKSHLDIKHSVNNDP